MIEIQNILDDLMAFWGIIDDSIASENVRSLIKIGKRLERSRLSYDKTALELIASFLKKEKPDYHQIVSETEKLLEV
ncbi:MAG: hypothetical protein ACI4OO_12225 [Otoolea sp.]